MQFVGLEIGLLGQDAGSGDGAGLTLAFCAPLITASTVPHS